MKRERRQSTVGKTPPPASEADNVSRMKQAFGKAIKWYRLQLRLSQPSLAEKMDGKVNQSYISQVERGLIFPGGVRFSALLTALGCSAIEVWEKAESLADIGLSAFDRESLFALLGHDQFSHRYEELKWFEESSHVVPELSATIDELYDSISGSKLNKHERIALQKQLKRFKELAHVYRAPPIVEQLVRLCDHACSSYAAIASR